MSRLRHFAYLSATAALLASLFSCTLISQYLALAPPAASTSSTSGQSSTASGGTSSGLTVVLSTTVKGGTAIAPIPVTVQFSAPVADFGLSSLSVANGTASSLTATSSMEYQVGVMPSGNTTVSVSVPAGVVHDSSGATNDASNQLSMTFSEPLPTVSFTNVANNGLLETSLLLGTASGTNGISGVDISFDGGASSQLPGTTAWSYRRPTTGTGAWKYHSIHTVTIQAFDAIGNYSTPVTITLRQGANEDVNGDGYPDLVVGAPAANGSSGAAYLFYGSASGLSGTLSSSGADLTLSDGSATSFGAAVAVGDLNGDGYADVAVGAPGTSSGAGAIYIYYGSASGLSSSPATIFTGAAASALGGSLAIGDVSGDGYGDLGATAAGSGDTYIFYGGPTPMTGGALSSISTLTTFSSSGTIPVGNEIAFGDVNGDGNLDVAVGGANSSGDGQVLLIQGSGAQLASDDLVANPAGLAITTISEEATGQGFGQSPIAFGDVNGDGFDDLVVGADEYPTSATGNGRIYIFDGGASAFTAGSTIQAASATTTITGPASSSSNLGSRIALGPVTPDGYDDLLAGSADQSIGSASSSYEQGHVYIFYGGSAGIPTTNLSTGGSADLTFTGPASSLFGTMPRQLLDLNGDGLADLVFGAPGASSNAGAVYLFDGSTSGFSTTATATIGGAAGEQLGIGLN